MGLVGRLFVALLIVAIMIVLPIGLFEAMAIGNGAGIWIVLAIMANTILTLAALLQVANVRAELRRTQAPVPRESAPSAAD